MKVFVYWNLHRKVWSVKALEGSSKGRVIGHLSEVNLIECQFKVSEKTRQKVVETRRKTVHAGVIGLLTEGCDIKEDNSVEVTYNPYKYKTFVNRQDTEQAVYKAQIVSMQANRSVRAVL